MHYKGYASLVHGLRAVQSCHFGFYSTYKNLHVYLGRYNNRGLKTKWMAQFKVYGIVLQPTVALTTSVLTRPFMRGFPPLDNTHTPWITAKLMYNLQALLPFMRDFSLLNGNWINCEMLILQMYVIVIPCLPGIYREYTKQ